MVEAFEGFDSMSMAQLTRRYGAVAGDSNSTMVTGRNSIGGAVHLQGGFNVQSYFTIPVTARSEYYLGFDFKPISFYGSNASTFLKLLGASTTILELKVTPTALNLISSYGNSANGAIALNAWQNVQIYLKVSATVGSLIVKVDGVTQINLTNINTGTADIVGVQVVSWEGSYFADPKEYDNLWIFNTTGSHSNTWPAGYVTAQLLVPTSDGTYTDFSLSAGSDHYANVDDHPANDDTDYNYGVAAGSQDTCHLSALAGTIALVHAVKVVNVVRKDDVDPKEAATLLKSGSTLAVGATVSMPLSYTELTTLYAADPHTAAQWTEANVNAVEVGTKVVS